MNQENFNQLHSFNEQSLDLIANAEVARYGDIEAVDEERRAAYEQEAFNQLHAAAADVPFEELGYADLSLARKEAQLAADKEALDKEIESVNRSLDDKFAELTKVIKMSDDSLREARIKLVAKQSANKVERLEGYMVTRAETDAQREQVNRVFASMLDWPLPALIDSAGIGAGARLAEPTSARPQPASVPEIYDDVISEPEPQPVVENEPMEVESPEPVDLQPIDLHEVIPYSDVRSVNELAQQIPSLVSKLGSAVSEHIHKRKDTLTIARHIDAITEKLPELWTESERNFIADIKYLESNFVSGKNELRYRKIYTPIEIKELVGRLRSVEREVLRIKQGQAGDLYEIEDDLNMFASIEPPRPRSMIGPNDDYDDRSDYMLRESEVERGIRAIDAQALAPYEMVDPLEGAYWDEFVENSEPDLYDEEPVIKDTFWAEYLDRAKSASESIMRTMVRGGERNVIRKLYPIEMTDMNVEGIDFSPVYQFVANKFALDVLGDRMTLTERESAPVFASNQQIILDYIRENEPLIARAPREIRLAREPHHDSVPRKLRSRMTEEHQSSAYWSIIRTACDLLARESRNFTRGMSVNEYREHLAHHQPEKLQKSVDLSVKGAIRHQKRLGMMIVELRKRLSEFEAPQTVTIEPLGED